MKESPVKKWYLLSWEPEILISGGLIFTLLSIRPYFNEFKLILEPYDLPGTNTFLLTLSAALGGLTFGFILHLLLRGFWIMLMGFYTNFPEPFNVDKFNFKKVYRSRLRDFDLHKKTVKLGNLSSLMFSVTFFFLLMSIGIVFLTTILMIIWTYFKIPGVIVIPIFLTILAIDFITLGYLKKTILGVILYPILIVLYYLSLSFLYRNIYYFLIQNIRKRYLIIGFFIFLSGSIVIGVLNIYQVFQWDLSGLKYRYELYDINSYDDERDTNSIYLASINSYYQDKDLLKLYIRGKSLH